MKETATGKIITAAVLIGAIYIGVKHYKSKEFWMGVAAMVLIGTSVTTYAIK